MLREYLVNEGFTDIGTTKLALLDTHTHTSRHTHIKDVVTTKLALLQPTSLVYQALSY